MSEALATRRRGAPSLRTLTEVAELEEDGSSQEDKENGGDNQTGSPEAGFLKGSFAAGQDIVNDLFPFVELGLDLGEGKRVSQVPDMNQGGAGFLQPEPGRAHFNALGFGRVKEGRGLFVGSNECIQPLLHLRALLVGLCSGVVATKAHVLVSAGQHLVRGAEDPVVPVASFTF